MYCVVLSPGSAKRVLVLEKCCPTSSWPVLQPLSFFSTPCYYQRSLIGSAARGYRDAVQVQGQLLSWGPTWYRQVGCDAACLRRALSHLLKREDHCMGTAVGEGLHCKHSNNCLSHASKLSSRQVAPLIDSVSLKSLFTSSPVQ